MNVAVAFRAARRADAGAYLNAWLRWLVGLALLAATTLCAAQTDLPSWKDGPSRRAIIAFVEKVTRAGSVDYVRPEDRIAVFDNDGTLWSEQPVYYQVQFALDELKIMARDRPDLASTEPYKAAIEGDRKTLAEAGKEGLLKIIGVTHTDITTEQFAGRVREWISTARHPRFNRPYTELTYAPMRELLDYLRARGFKTYIVSGGGVEFMRVWAEQAYGIPPEQVIGSTFVTDFRWIGDRPELMRMPKVDYDDDGPGKPVSINKFIGRQPIFAFGNSDGDLQMLQWTVAGAGSRFAGLVHHTDSEREWAYDRESRIGTLNKALDEARRQDWVVVDIKQEWAKVYAFDPMR